MPAPSLLDRPRTPSRREMMLAALGLGAFAFVAGCGSSSGATTSPAPSNAQPSAIDPTTVQTSLVYEDNLDALFDVLIPAVRDASGKVTSPGAREVSAGALFGDATFVSTATGLGWIPPLSTMATQTAIASAAALRVALDAALDVRAARLRPLTAFKDLPADLQMSVVDDALTDVTAAPVIRVVRAAAWVAYLGAVSSDAGLVEVGFPPYENFADGLAASGYPRTMDGRLIDTTKEDLKALAAASKLDDYTYNRDPGFDPATLGLDANGDLP